MERMAPREKERDRERERELTNGLLLSQARVTVRAWPRRVVFPENRLERIRASATHARLAFYRKFDSARIMIHSGGYRIAPCRRVSLTCHR